MPLALVAQELHRPRRARLGERAVHPRLRFPAPPAHRRVVVELNDVDVRLHCRVVDLLVPVLVARAGLAFEVKPHGGLRLAPSAAPSLAPRDAARETTVFGLLACPDLDDVAGVAREGAAPARVPAAHTLGIGAPLAGRKVDHEPDFVPRRDAAAARGAGAGRAGWSRESWRFPVPGGRAEPEGRAAPGPGAPRRGGLRTRRCARSSPQPSAASTRVGTPAPERPAGRSAWRNRRRSRLPRAGRTGPHRTPRLPNSPGPRGSPPSIAGKAGCAAGGQRRVRLGTRGPTRRRRASSRCRGAGTPGPVVLADGERLLAKGVLITYEPHVPGSTPAREPDSGH